MGYPRDDHSSAVAWGQHIVDVRLPCLAASVTSNGAVLSDNLLLCSFKAGGGVCKDRMSSYAQ